MGAEGDTDRKTVMTYVPAYQKSQWRDHAEQLGMSQSEYVRTMVQAGRREFEIPPAPGREEGENSHDAEGGFGAVNPRGNGPERGLQKQVETVLSTSTYHSWDELLSALTDNIEDRLDETLQEMQAANEIRYSGRHGGYALTEDTETDR